MTVSKQGRRVAVMMSIHDYEEMKLMRLRAHLAEGEADIQSGNFTTMTNADALHDLFENMRKKEARTEPEG